ncbi:hypothetical protein FA95DRAFT_1601597 [Auriscalpium vulgare]|uniref:Uncharacterized protein n=1 Tax=Auriscalpium vulgare TaxID=40419 RepID=A0ACB8S9V7_9AGAM|nr:hypothetical protein FA95DRAFT_1601597 [Auriscalpium vulgare]
MDEPASPSNESMELLLLLDGPKWRVCRWWPDGLGSGCDSTMCTERACVEMCEVKVERRRVRAVGGMDSLWDCGGSELESWAHQIRARVFDRSPRDTAASARWAKHLNDASGLVKCVSDGRRLSAATSMQTLLGLRKRTQSAQQVYTTHGGDAHRGNWGLKRPLAVRNNPPPPPFVGSNACGSESPHIAQNQAGSPAEYKDRRRRGVKEKEVEVPAPAPPEPPKKERKKRKAATQQQRQQRRLEEGGRDDTPKPYADARVVRRVLVDRDAERAERERVDAGLRRERVADVVHAQRDREPSALYVDCV